MFKKADRKRAKLRLALCGVAGSGKTYSALRIAKGLGGRVALLDTERGSGELYSAEFDYDIACLDNDFSPANYIKIINEAEKSGYDILIIDSLSHAWMGEGGVLDILDKASKASASKNSYTAWRTVTPQHNALVDAILKSKMHIIVTMRSKADYVVVESENSHGRKTSSPQKIGLAPIQREGLDFEFTVVLDLSVDGNIATSSKDRTKLFAGKNILITEKTGEELLEWLENGKAEPTEAEVFEEYRIKLEQTQNMLELQKVFAQAWKAVESESYRSTLTAIKDQKKEEFNIGEHHREAM